MNKESKSENYKVPSVFPAFYVAISHIYVLSGFLHLCVCWMSFCNGDDGKGVLIESVVGFLGEF